MPCKAAKNPPTTDFGTTLAPTPLLLLPNSVEQLLARAIALVLAITEFQQARARACAPFRAGNQLLVEGCRQAFDDDRVHSVFVLSNQQSLIVEAKYRHGVVEALIGAWCFAFAPWSQNQQCAERDQTA